MDVEINNNELIVKNNIRYCFRTCKEISDDTGINPVTVIRIMKKLRKYDEVFIVKDKVDYSKRRNTPYRYKLKG